MAMVVVVVVDVVLKLVVAATAVVTSVIIFIGVLCALFAPQAGLSLPLTSRCAHCFPSSWCCPSPKVLPV
jgi:hypothetical protein